MLRPDVPNAWAPDFCGPSPLTIAWTGVLFNLLERRERVLQARCYVVRHASPMIWACLL